MENLHTEKRKFIENELFNLIKRIDSTVEKMAYNNEYGEETVYVIYKTSFSINCNVTGNTLAEVARNILKRI